MTVASAETLSASPRARCPRRASRATADRLRAISSCPLRARAPARQIGATTAEEFVVEHLNSERRNVSSSAGRRDDARFLGVAQALLLRRADDSYTSSAARRSSCPASPHEHVMRARESSSSSSITSSSSSSSGISPPAVPNALPSPASSASARSASATAKSQVVRASSSFFQRVDPILPRLVAFVDRSDHLQPAQRVQREDQLARASLVDQHILLRSSRASVGRRAPSGHATSTQNGR